MENEMLFFGESLKKRLREFCRQYRRGVWKRIDENRELLVLLQKEEPEFLERCFWVEGWLESQDEFLQELARISEVPKHPNIKDFPRPWPGSGTLVVDLVRTDIATCIGCGCRDDRACMTSSGPCLWLWVDYTAGEGVCSECPDYLLKIADEKC